MCQMGELVHDYVLDESRPWESRVVQQVVEGSRYRERHSSQWCLCKSP